MKLAIRQNPRLGEAYASAKYISRQSPPFDDVYYSMLSIAKEIYKWKKNCCHQGQISNIYSLLEIYNLVTTVPIYCHEDNWRCWRKGDAKPITSSKRPSRTFIFRAQIFNMQKQLMRRPPYMWADRRRNTHKLWRSRLSPHSKFQGVGGILPPVPHEAVIN